MKISSEEVEKQFLKELQALLEKWGAYINVEASGDDPDEMGVCIPVKCDSYGRIAEQTQFDLGRHIDKDSFKEESK